MPGPLVKRNQVFHSFSGRIAHQDEAFPDADFTRLKKMRALPYDFAVQFLFKVCSSCYRR
jgi:hypothetical protein